MRGTKTFSLIKGTIEIDNSIIKVSYNSRRYTSSILKFSFAVIFIISTKSRIDNFDSINSNYEYIKFSLFVLATIFLIYVFIHSLFKNIWTNKIELNDIVKVIIDKNEHEKEIDEDSEIEIKLIKNNGRSKLVKLKKDENQLESFLEELKKRNTRIKTEYIH